MSFWSGRRVFVTGGTGFLGYWLIGDLVKAGAEVTALVRDQVAAAPFFHTRLADKVSIVRGSVEHYPLMERALAEHESETVFHLAAQAIVGVANRNPLATFETNVKGTWVVMEACRRNGGVSRVVVASSDKAYGIHETLPYTEAAALKGSHPYDVSKSCADLIATAYHNTYGTPVSITRCGNLFGPGDLNFSRIVPGTIRSVLQGERPIIRSDGSPIRDYVHVQDIARAYMLLAEKMEHPAICGKAFNFGTGEPLSVLDLTKTILKVAGREDLEPDILDEVHGEIHHQYLSSERARQLLGWRPGAPVAERLRETIQWYRGHLEGRVSGPG